MTAYTGRELENAKAFSLTTFTEKIREKIVSICSSEFNIMNLNSLTCETYQPYSKCITTTPLWSLIKLMSYLKNFKD